MHACQEEKGKRPGKNDLRSYCFFESQKAVMAKGIRLQVFAAPGWEIGLTFVLEPRLPGTQLQEIRTCSHHSLCVPKQKRREGGWPP